MFAHAVTLALSSLSLVFVFPMLFGLRGAVAWTYMENERNTVTTKYSVGLQEIESFSSQNEGASTLIQFGGDACKNSLKDSTCNSCKEAGGATFAFTFFAMLFLVALLATQYARFLGRAKILYSGNNWLTVPAIEFGSCFCFFLAWVIWQGGCHKALEDDDATNNFNKIELSAGWALAFLSFILTGCGGAFEIVFRDNLKEPYEGVANASKETMHNEEGGNKKGSPAKEEQKEEKELPLEVLVSEF
mmetsp:Transcript_7631/g.10828  ORF Transcript_7631/g.10828 Transcript_7631/m.10828 type:complete len:246 (+) Transcript_7631:68-805(+)